MELLACLCQDFTGDLACRHGFTNQLQRRHHTGDVPIVLKCQDRLGDEADHFFRASLLLIQRGQIERGNRLVARLRELSEARPRSLEQILCRALLAPIAFHQAFYPFKLMLVEGSSDEPAENFGFLQGALGFVDPVCQCAKTCKIAQSDEIEAGFIQIRKMIERAPEVGYCLLGAPPPSDYTGPLNQTLSTERRVGALATELKCTIK